MANATGPLNTIVREGDLMPLALAAVKVYHGAAAAVVSGVGYGTPLVAASTTTLIFVGVFTETKDNTAGTAGGVFTTIRRKGAVLFSQTGTTITAANIGNVAYFSDDNTITLATGTIYAGIIVAVDASGGVWVDITTAVQPYSATNYNGVYGLAAVSTLAAASTVTNVSGAAQLMASAKIAANLLAVGDRIRVRGQIVGTTRTASDTLAVVLGANTSAAVAGITSLFTLAASFAHATTNFLFFELELVVQSIGGSGAVLGGGIVSGGTAGATLAGVAVASTAVATNADLYIVLQGTFSASNTTDQATVNIFDVDVVRHQ